MTRSRLLQRSLSLLFIPLLIGGYSAGYAQPASGDWKVPTAFGELIFTVNPEGTKVTKIIRDVRNWLCGPVSGSWTTTTSWGDPQAGWPISNGQFTIVINGSMGSLTTIWTVNGTFSSAGTEASGTWSFSISGTICSGNWGPVGPLVFVVKDSDFPGQFSLSQNYPNPFNPSTTIKYELPKSADVRLSVFDPLGREISVLVNQRKDAGVHEVTFDGAGLSSGVYFYRMQATDFVSTKRIMVLK
jgi:hypothetical protein